MELNKKGIFFTMDAFMGLSLFILILVTLYIFFISAGTLEQQYYISEDFFDVFSNIKFDELDTEKYDGVFALLVEGKINNTDYTLSEQIIILSSEGNDANASLLVGDFTEGLLDERFGFSFELEDEIYARENKKNSLGSRGRLLTG